MTAEELPFSKLCQITPFQERVYRVVAQIPRGMVMTYRDLAQAIGCASCQAVGQALRRNPFAPTIPCHRVIKTDLTPGGYLGRQDDAAIDRKLELLAIEGVVFVDGVLRDSDRLFSLESMVGTRVSSAFS